MRALAAEQSEVSPEQRRAVSEAFEILPIKYHGLT
ncbi:hypothetical protein ACLK19_12080 [Escherichia coli]